MKPYYQDATTTLYLGDALEIMPALRLEGKASAFTDPPYNAGMIYGPNVNDRVANEVFLAWSALWIASRSSTCCHRWQWHRQPFTIPGRLSKSSTPSAAG